MVDDISDMMICWLLVAVGVRQVQKIQSGNLIACKIDSAVLSSTNQLKRRLLESKFGEKRGGVKKKSEDDWHHNSDLYIRAYHSVTDRTIGE